MQHRLLATGIVLSALVGGTGAAAPPEENTPEFTYIIVARVISSVNEGEWGCNELYSKSGPAESSLTFPVAASAQELAQNIWRGDSSRCASDVAGWVSVTVAHSTQETGSVIVNQRFWESDDGNEDDFLGYVHEEIPVDGRTHVMRSIHGDRPGLDYVDFAVSVEILYPD